MDAAILTILALVPLLGAGLVMLASPSSARVIGMGASVIALGIAVGVLVTFDRSSSAMQFVLKVPWIEQLGINYAVGVDGIGLTLVMLTTILVPVVLLASWDDAEYLERGRFSSKAFFALVLVLESFSLLVFLATDVFMFYVFFEATLIPMYFLIGGFGGKKRSQAAVKFLMFSLAGGLVLLAAVVGLYVVSAEAGKPSYLLEDLIALDLSGPVGNWLFIGFMFAFAVKAPMVPFHTWLPDAAEESTPGGAALMVGILDKIGTFGMIRFCLGIFPEASTWATPVVTILAVISVLYGAIVALAQRDLFRLISFTSISHFGFIVLGIFAFTNQSVAGATFYMLNHGLSTTALFLVIGYAVARRGSRDISAFGGVAQVAPYLAGFTLVAGLSALALPGLSSFVSEFMVLSGTFSRYPIHAIVATLGIVLAALYVLIMYQRTMTGPVTAQVADFEDLSPRETSALVPLVVLIVVLGVFPGPALQVINPSVAATLEQVGVTDPVPPYGQEQPR